MWMVVMFDLPVMEKAERKAATQFRNGLLDLGFDAALVGTSLMRGNDPGRELAELLHGGRFHA